MPQLRKGFTNTSFIDPDDLNEAITSTLNEFSDKVADGTKKAVDIVTKEAAAEILRHISFTQRTGDYVKAFATKTAFVDKRNKRNTWYVKSPQYRLTHLLEKGHKTKKANDAQAYPHIKYGAELAARRLPQLIEDLIKGG